MIRKLLTSIFILIIVVSMFITAEAEITPPASFGAPENFGVSHYYGNSVYYTFSAPLDLRRFIEQRAADDPENKQSLTVYFQIDYKIDNGNWHHTSEWDSPETAPYGIQSRYFVFKNGECYTSGERWNMNEFFPDDESLKLFADSGWEYLKSHSVTFRARLAMPFGSGKYVLSPWSKEFTLSANVKEDYSKLINHAPSLTSAELKTTAGGEPYFLVKLEKAPADILYLHALSGGSLRTEVWMRRAGDKDFKYIYYEWSKYESLKIEASDYFSVDNSQQSYKAEGYEIKVRYALDLRNYKQSGFYDSSSTVDIYSPYSNVISHNMPAWSEASQWAAPELKRADDMGLIPNILKGADMTKSITREEFAELAVKLYEKSTDTNALPASPNPFTDTSNNEILKAYKLGITQGTSATTFSPSVLINREQCAAMLFRTIKAIKPDGDYSIAGVTDFPDQKNISPYAVESTKFMSKLSIIKGDSSGNFMPKATTTAQTAAGYGMATREAAILMGVRSYDKMDDIQTVQPSAPPAESPKQPEQPAKTETKSGSIVGKWGSGSSGAVYDMNIGGFKFGAYGMGDEYVFSSDGTFVQLISSGLGTAISISGNYTVSGDTVTLTNQSSKVSKDRGQTWSAGNSPADTSRYYIINTDSSGSKYILIGLEGAELPLDTSTNAVSYYYKE